MSRNAFVRRVAHRAGIELSRLGLSSVGDTVINRCLKLVGPIGTVIDVGASDGRWSLALQKSLPSANYLMVEAQEQHRPSLERLARNPRMDFVLAAASDQTGVLHFLDNGPVSGSASTEAFADHDISVPCVAVDEAVQDRRLSGPYLLKLDTHGHEVEILRGAEQALKEASLVILEAYNFANFGRLMFDEMCQHMRGYGFRPAGIADVMVRRDGLLWQMDIAFLPDTHPAFQDVTYTPF